MAASESLRNMLSPEPLRASSTPQPVFTPGFEEIVEEVEEDEPSFTPALSQKEEKPYFLQSYSKDEEENITSCLEEMLVDNDNQYTKEIGQEISETFGVTEAQVVKLLHWCRPRPGSPGVPVPEPLPLDAVNFSNLSVMGPPSMQMTVTGGYQEEEDDLDVPEEHLMGLAPMPMKTQKSLPGEGGYDQLDEHVEEGDSDEPHFTPFKETSSSLSSSLHRYRSDIDEPAFVSDSKPKNTFDIPLSEMGGLEDLSNLGPPKMTQQRTGMDEVEDGSDHSEHIESESDEPDFGKNIIPKGPSIEAPADPMKKVKKIDAEKTVEH